MSNPDMRPPYEFAERASRFVETVKVQIFPSLQKEGFYCDVFTLLASAKEEELWDDTDADREARQALQRVQNEFKEELVGQRLDRAELLLTGPLDKRQILEDARGQLQRLAGQFNGQESFWSLDEAQTAGARIAQAEPGFSMRPGREKELRLLASYQFQGEPALF